jgi:hypothetical protein
MLASPSVSTSATSTPSMEATDMRPIKRYVGKG